MNLKNNLLIFLVLTISSTFNDVQAAAAPAEGEDPILTWVGCQDQKAAFIRWLNHVSNPNSWVCYPIHEYGGQGKEWAEMSEQEKINVKKNYFNSKIDHQKEQLNLTTISKNEDIRNGTLIPAGFYETLFNFQNRTIQCYQKLIKQIENGEL